MGKWYENVNFHTRIQYKKGENMKIKKLLGAVGLISASVLFVGCGGGSGGGSVEYVAYDAPAISASQKKEFLDAVNEARAVGRECGKYGYMPAVPPLKWDDRLYNAAYEHSEDMATTSHYAHTGSGKESDWTAQVLDLGRGSTLTERFDNNGLTRIGTGENVAAMYYTTKNVMEAWLKSDGHCKNIMDKKSTIFGMAFVENENSQYKIYWTQDFGGE